MNNKQLLKFHLLFWFIILFYGDLLQAIGSKDYHFTLNRFTNYFYLTSTFFRIVVSYGILFVVNRYFDARQYLKMAGGIVAVIFAYIGCRYFLEEVLCFALWGVRNYEHGDSFTALYYITDNFFNGISFIFNATFFKMINDFFKNEKIKNDLKNEKTVAELAFLKSQLNPHFLFNTLNNIYVLTYQKSDKAPAAMLKLAEIMRYMLYESNEPLVDLEQEVKYLTNMIELQKMRYHGTVFIEATMQGNFAGKRIAPLLLAPFVENAFKHGDVGDKDNPLIINLLESHNNVHFSVRNKKRPQNKDEVGGVGMENVQRRLDLLYAGKFSLDIQDDEKSYYCELNVML
jgi:two-component system, LytTR family, sensor kinase